MAATGYGLTPLQERFVALYVAYPNKTLAECYREAGFEVTTDDSARCNASRLLRKDHIWAAVEKERERLRGRLEVTADQIAEETRKLAFFNLGDLVNVTDAGDPYIDLSGATREQMAALASVNVDEYIEGRGPSARVVKSIAIKGPNKLSALVELNKMLGFARPEKYEHDHKGLPAGGEKATDDELIGRLQAILMKAAKRAEARAL